MTRGCWVTFQCGASYNFDYSRARAYCACSRCGWGLFGLFTLLYPFSPLSPSLWETARYRLKYCLKGPLKPKTTNQPKFIQSHISVLYFRSGQVVRWHWANFQCRGILLVWIKVGQGPTALALGSGGGCFDVCLLSPISSHFFLPLSRRRPDID